MVRVPRISQLPALRPRVLHSVVPRHAEALHRSFEEQFWGTKMALSDEKYSVAELTRT